MSESRKKDISTTIGQRINELLAKNNVMQKELADHLGIQHNTISYYLKGERVPDYPKLVAIAEYFNVSTDYLLGRTDTKTVDEDIQMICDYTGLSESAVDNLHLWNNEYLGEGVVEILNQFISPEEKPDFNLRSLLQCLYNYNNCYIMLIMQMERSFETIKNADLEDAMDIIDYISKDERVMKTFYYEAVDEFKKFADRYISTSVETPKTKNIYENVSQAMKTRTKEYRELLFD